MKRQRLVQTASMAAYLFVVVAMEHAQTTVQSIDTRHNINSETFTNAPQASSEVVAAILKFQVANNKEPVDSSDVNDNRKSFRFLPVSLGPNGEHDLIVEGDFPFTGVDNDWYWIVRELPSGPRIVLWLNCLNFSVTKGTAHGMNNIVSEWNSPNEKRIRQYHFNGRKYVLTSEKWNKMP